MGYYFRSGYSIAEEQLEELSYKIAEKFVNELYAKKLKYAINQSVVESQDINTIIDIDKLKDLLGSDEHINTMEELVDKCSNEDGDEDFIDMFDVDKQPPSIDDEGDLETRFF